MALRNKVKIYSYPKLDGKKNSDEEILASVREYLSNADARVLVERDEYGKPHVKTDKELFVSVAHDGGLCLVAVAEVPVGIDLERADRTVKRRSGIARRCFCEDEIRFLGENMTDLAFTEMWVKKEALSKLIGKGVPCMKDKSVFSDDLVFERIYDYEGFIAYYVTYNQ